MKIKNENGYSLLLVLLVSLIFMTLGLAIISASIGGAKRTEIRGEDIQTTYKAVRVLEEVIAEFHAKINEPSFKLDEAKLLNGQYQSILNGFIIDLTIKYRNMALIEDLSSQYNINPHEHFTRVYSITVTANGEDGRSRTANRRLFLSPTPSFLSYVAGAGPEGVINLNGGTKIIGNMYGNTMNVSDTAYFSDLVSENNSTLSVYPAIQGELYLRGELNGTSQLSNPLLKNYFFQSESNPTENGIPIIKSDTGDFIDVNFKKTFAQKINQLEGYAGLATTENDFLSETDINNVIKLLLTPCQSSILQFNECQSPLYLIEKDWNYLDINSQNLASYDTILYSDINITDDGTDFVVNNSNSNDIIPLFITNDLELDDAWLVVHGNMIIDSSVQSPLRISGNILVTGNLIIKGDDQSPDGSDELEEDDEVQFDSTIYTLGRAEISNTDISGLDNKQLVLLSQEDIFITRLNEFKDFTDSITPLEAYFYTDSSANLYGVGSLFYIKGGLFAQENLTINAIRQNSIQKSYNLGPYILPASAQKNQSSRFTIEYDKEVILDQLDALPRVDRLQLILDDMTIE